MRRAIRRSLRVAWAFARREAHCLHRSLRHLDEAHLGASLRATYCTLPGEARHPSEGALLLVSCTCGAVFYDPLSEKLGLPKRKGGRAWSKA